MARSRVIKPEFWDDEKLATISRDARLTFIGLWTNSDDYGVVKGHLNWLRHQIYPYDDISKPTFEKWIVEIEATGSIIPFSHHNEKYYFIRHFTDHQKVSHPSPSRNPSAPIDILDGGGIAQEPFGNDSGKILEETEYKQKQNINRKRMFDSFWEKYPNKKSKGNAEKTFKKINPDEQLLAIMIAKIEQAKKSREWLKNDGEFIPHPSSWLNAKGWEDEIEATLTKSEETPEQKAYYAAATIAYQKKVAEKKKQQEEKNKIPLPPVKSNIFGEPIDIESERLRDKYESKKN